MGVLPLRSRPLPSRAPAQSKRPENTRQLCFSFLLVPLLLETGGGWGMGKTGHKAASTSNQCPVPGGSTSALTARGPAHTPMGTQT